MFCTFFGEGEFFVDPRGRPRRSGLSAEAGVLAFGEGLGSGEACGSAAIRAL